LPITFINTTEATSVANSLTITKPACVNACDLLIGVISSGAGAQLSACSLFTFVTGGNSNSAGHCTPGPGVNLWYRVATACEGASYTWGTGVASNAGHILHFRGTATSAPQMDVGEAEKGWTQHCSGNSFDPKVSEVVASGLHATVAVLGDGTNAGGANLTCAGSTVPSGYTLGNFTLQSNDSLAYTGYKIFTCAATSDDPGAFSTDGCPDVFRSGTLIILVGTSAPTITSLTPSTGPTSGGTSVVIAGTDFCGGCETVTRVRFGGVCANSFTVNSSTQVTAISPAHSTGAKDVVLTNAVGSSANTANDDYTYTGGSAKGATPGKKGTPPGQSSCGPGKRDCAGSGGSSTEPSIFVAYPPSASESLQAQLVNCNSSTRTDGIWPSGQNRSLRVLMVEYQSLGACANGLELYFGSGTNICTNAGKEITEFRSAAITYQGPKRWPDGAGPIGLPGERLSYRGTAAVFNQPTRATIHYREE